MRTSEWLCRSPTGGADGPDACALAMDLVQVPAVSSVEFKEEVALGLEEPAASVASCHDSEGRLRMDLQVPGGRPRDLPVNEFLEAAHGVRARLPALAPESLVDLVVEPLALCDGLDWEASRSGVDIRPGCFVRLAPGSLARFPGWSFIGKVAERLGRDFWQVDLGADHDEILAVPNHWLHRIQADLNLPGVVEAYMSQCKRQGRNVSRRLTVPRRPVDT